MEIEFDGKRKKGKTPGTRMYATGKKQKQSAKQPVVDAREKNRKRSADDTVVDEEGYRIHLSEDADNPLARIGVMFSGFLLAGMILFTLFGYEQISRAYADINTLKDEIELTRLRITALDVEIECAVTIQQAQEAAEAAHMRYPTQSQYVKIGQKIPFSGALTAAATPTVSAPPDAAAQNSPVPDPAATNATTPGGAGIQPDGTYIPPLETGGND